MYIYIYIYIYILQILEKGYFYLLMYTMFTLREFPFFVRLISHATLTSTETRCLHLPQGQATRPDPARPRGKRVDIQKNL